MWTPQPLQAVPPLSPLECLRIIAVFRLLLPRQQITIAGGRDTQLGEFQNRTEQHVDTKALGQGIRTTLMQSGKIQFVAESQRTELLKEQE